MIADRKIMEIIFSFFTFSFYQIFHVYSQYGNKGSYGLIVDDFHHQPLKNNTHFLKLYSSEIED